MSKTKGIGTGERISSFGLAAMILLLLVVCLSGRVRAGAQTAEQAAQIVKSLSIAHPRRWLPG